MVEFGSSSSGSSTEASGEKANAKASGDLTVTFVYQNDSGSNCTLETTAGINTSGYNETFDPTDISGSGSLASGCGSAADFDGVKAAFEPGSNSSASGLTLRILDADGNELASDDGSDGNLSASATASDDVTFPDDGDDDSGDDGSGDDGDTTAPNAPSNLSANASDGSVDLDWDAVDASDLNGYNVYRSTSSNIDVSGTSPINESPLSNASYTDDGVENGTEYYYVVTAVDDSDNESNASDEVSATPSDNTAPNAPSNLSASAGDGSVTLNWDAVSASDLDGYNVYRSTSSISDVSGMDPINGSIVSNTSYTDDGVSNGTTYYYVVTAVDDSGNESSSSMEITVTPRKAGLVDVTKSSASIGDIDRDGELDLVITGEDKDSRVTTKAYLGNGDGGFLEVGDDLTGVRNGSTSLGDLNGDNNPDLVVTGQGVFGRNSTVYLGNGDGSFSETANLTPVDASSTSLGYINNDDNLDLVLSGKSNGGEQTTTLYLGDGDGTFSKAEAGLVDLRSSATALGDLNGDGDLDLVLAGMDKNDNRTTKAYLGDGSGGFSEVNTVLPDVRDGSMSLAKIDGDDNLDLVLTGLSEQNGAIAKVYLGDGSGGFSEAGTDLTGVQEGSTALGDLDGDGNLDLVLTGSDGLDFISKVYLGDGSGGFSEVQTNLTNVGDGSTSSLGDFDNDGNLDLVLTGQASSGEVSEAYRGDGTGGFESF